MYLPTLCILTQEEKASADFGTMGKIVSRAATIGRTLVNFFWRLLDSSETIDETLWFEMHDGKMFVCVKAILH